MIPLLLSLAGAATLDADDLREIIARARPHVEARTGRAFDPVPTTVLADQDDVRAELAENHDAMVEHIRKVEGDEAAERTRKELEERFEHAAGLYSPRTNRMYVVADKIERDFARGGLPHDLLEPFVFCLMVHELTHALQDQQKGSLGLVTSADFHAHRAVVEGHAALVTEQTCARGAHRFLEARRQVAGGTVAIASTEPTGATWAYGWGREYVRHVQSTGGNQAVWDLITRANRPTPDEIEQAVRSARPEAWTDPPLDSWLDQILLEIPGDPDERVSGPGDPFATLYTFAGYGFERGLHLRSSHGAAARLGTRVVGVLLYAFDGPLHAEELVARRRKAPDSHVRPKVATPWMPYARFAGVPSAVKLGRAKKEGFDAAIHWHVDTDDRELNYYWFADGDALLILYFYGEPAKPGTIWAVARQALNSERVPMPAVSAPTAP